MEKWGRNLYVLRYTDGKFAAINTNKNVLKKVDLKQAYLFTKNKKYLFLARDGIKYLISLALIIVIIYFTLRYLHL